MIASAKAKRLIRSAVQQMTTEFSVLIQLFWIGSPRSRFSRLQFNMPRASSLLPILFAVVAFLAPIIASQAQPAQPIDVTSANFAELLDDLASNNQRGLGRDPDARNGYPALLTACARYFEVAATRGRVDLTAIHDDGVILPGGTHEDAVKAATDFLAELDRVGVFDRLDQLATAPRVMRSRLDSPARDADRAALGSTDKWNGNLMGAPLPEIQPIRELARACAARMHLAATANDPEAFIRAFTQGLAISRAEFHQPMMIDGMVGASVRELILSRANADLVHLQLTAKQLDQLRASLDKQTDGLPPLDFAFRGERLAILDMCRWAFDSRGRLQPQRLVDAYLIARLPPKSDPMFEARRDANVKQVEACYVDLLAGAAQPRASRPDLDQIVQNRVAAGPPADVVMLGYIGASGRYLNTMDAAALNLAGFRVVLAVEQFQRAAGRYPDSLDQVVAQGFLAQIPADAITGTPIRYRTLNADEAKEHARAYLVYSVGADGVDDSGRPSPDPKSDARFDAAAKGFDYVFNAVR